MAVLQLRTFADIQAAVREEVGIQSTDTTAINRIKRDINIVYTEVKAAKRWWWLNGYETLQLPAYIHAGTATVVEGSAEVTLTIAPTASKKRYKFAIDGFNEIYTIESHSASSVTLKLTEVYAGVSGSGLGYKIWTDAAPLPTDCKETVSVWHDHSQIGVEAKGLKDFRRISAMNPRAEGKPVFYSTGDFVDPSQVSDITSLPAVSTRASAGVIKTIKFVSSIPQAVIDKVDAGDPVRWNISGAGHPSYNGILFISAISTTTNTNDTITFTGRAEHTESATADSSMVVRQLDQEVDYDRYREILFYPSLSTSRLTVHVDYVKECLPLENSNDEPIMPIEDRVVLLYGALHRQWARIRNPEEASRNLSLYDRTIAKMEGKLQDTHDSPKLRPSKIYLGAKRGPVRRARLLEGNGSIDGFGSSGASVATGTPNTAAVFGVDGVLTSSPNVSPTEVTYLDGVTSNIQDQIDSINGLADGKIYIGDAGGQAAEYTVTGDISLSNVGVAAISSGVIVDADVNASAAITKSKLAPGTVSMVEVTNASGYLTESTVTATELTFLSNVEPLTSFAMSDNQASAATVASWALASYDSIEVDYSIKRGSANKSKGTIHICSDGTNAAMANSEASIGTTGVTFSVDVSGGSIRLRYTSTSTGTAPAMKYKASKWLA